MDPVGNKQIRDYKSCCIVPERSKVGYKVGLIGFPFNVILVSLCYNLARLLGRIGLIIKTDYDPIRLDRFNKD